MGSFDSPGVGSRAIAADHLDTGMFGQADRPVRQDQAQQDAQRGLPRYPYPNRGQYPRSRPSGQLADDITDLGTKPARPPLIAVTPMLAA